jgi:hypothetical protein
VKKAKFRKTSSKNQVTKVSAKPSIKKPRLGDKHKKATL